MVAVSGGADSVALLDVLCQLRPALGVGLACAHVHHGLRPEADADAAFVGRLAEQFDVPFHLARVAVRREPPWDGLEAEARRARYAALEAGALTLGAVRIATGHTADDQAETVLMRLLEGAGPRGLAAIAPARGVFIRPLLETPRSQILGYLRARGLPWITDATNADLRFRRNRVRRQIMPVLIDAFGPRLVESLCRSAALSRELVAELDRQARWSFEQMRVKTASGLVFAARQLEAMPAELAAATILMAMRELGESRPWRGATHLLLRRLLLPAVRSASVRVGGLTVERSGAHVRVGPAALAVLRPRRFQPPASVELDELGLRLEARCFARESHWAVPRDTRRVAFDADQMPPIIAVRGRRPGDRFAPFGGTGERRLKSFLIDAGIPRWERDRVPLLDAAGEIAWVAGVRRGRIAAVTANTARILEVTLDAL